MLIRLALNTGLVLVAASGPVVAEHLRSAPLISPVLILSFAAAFWLGYRISEIFIGRAGVAAREAGFSLRCLPLDKA